MAFPEEPDVPASQRAVVATPLRYADISQAGRMALMGMPYSFGQAVWRPLVAEHPMTRPLAKSGVVPILTKLVMEGGDGPASVRDPVELHGCYQLGHTVDEAGQPSRILM